jgi:hypothetical protein
VKSTASFDRTAQCRRFPVRDSCLKASRRGYSRLWLWRSGRVPGGCSQVALGSVRNHGTGGHDHWDIAVELLPFRGHREQDCRHRQVWRALQDQPTSERLASMRFGSISFCVMRWAQMKSAVWITAAGLLGPSEQSAHVDDRTYRRIVFFGERLPLFHNLSWVE